MSDVEQPTAQDHTPESDRPPPQDWSGLRWLVVGTAVGVTGGATAGLADLLVQMLPVLGLMTPSLWLEAASFHIISHTVAWTLACVLICAAIWLPARLSAVIRSMLAPTPLALAAFGCGLAVVILWPQTARTPSLGGAVLIWLVATIAVGWAFSRLRATAPARWAFQAGRVAACIAVVLMIASIVVQWRSRSRVHAAEGFWPVAASQPTTTPSRKPPNVVLVVFDTLRVDRLGCYGYDRPTSPHIDAFAADSVLFKRAVSPGIWTVPSHASMFTGLHGSQHGMSWADAYLPERFATLAEVLKGRDYDTLGLSNNPHVSPTNNYHQGFDRFEDPSRLEHTARGWLYLFIRMVVYQDSPLGPWFGRWYLNRAGGRVTHRLADRWLADRDSDKPFFLFINYMEPHRPCEPTRAHRRAFVDDDDLARSYKLDQSGQAVYRYMLAGAPIYSPRDMAILSDLYDARVRELDDFFADLMRTLDEHADLDNTLIILTSDHGENLGDHGMLDHQYCIYNTLIHVPLIVRYPPAWQPQQTDAVVQTLDIFPTVLRAVGAQVKQTKPLFARSLEAALAEDDATPPRTAYAEYLLAPSWPFLLIKPYHPDFNSEPWKVSYRAVVTDRWKLIVPSEGDRELYDWQAEPGEESDLADRHSVDASRLHQRLKGWLGSFNPIEPGGPSDRPPGPINVDRRARLRDLGYLR